MHFKLWTNYELKLLRETLSNLASGADLYTELEKKGLKRTPNAVFKKIKALGLVRPLEIKVKEETDFSALNYINELKEALGTYIPQKKFVVQEEAASSMVVLFSDHHCGKSINSPSLGVFNKNVFSNRVDSLFSQVYSEFLMCEPSEVVFLFNGDMVDGEQLFPTQNHHTDLNAVDQVKLAAKVYWENLVSLAKNASNTKIKVYCVTGNHGRVSKGHAELSNWDNMLYYSLQLLSQSKSNPGNITVVVSDEEFLVVDVCGHKGYVKHILPKDTSSSTNRDKFSAWQKLHKFSWAVGGHWHESKFEKSHDIMVFYNGSLVGMDDYTERIGKYTTPCQWLWVVNKTNPCVYMKELRLK